MKQTLFRANIDFISQKIFAECKNDSTLTLNKIAQRAGLSGGMLTRILSGKTTGIHVRTACRLQKIFGDAAVISAPAQIN